MRNMIGNQREKHEKKHKEYKEKNTLEETFEWVRDV